MEQIVETGKVLMNDPREKLVSLKIFFYFLAFTSYFVLHSALYSLLHLRLFVGYCFYVFADPLIFPMTFWNMLEKF